MEDARTSTSSQRLYSTFDTLIESPEADITANPIFRPEPFPTGKNRDILVSVQELVYGSKAAGVGASSKSFDGYNELISSSKEVHGPRKDREPSEGLKNHVLQRTSPTDKSLVEKPKNFIRVPEEKVGPKKGQQPCGSSPSLHKQEYTSKSAKQGQESPKEQSEGQEKVKGKGKIQVEQTLSTELQNSKERKDSHGQYFQHGKESDGIQKQGGGKNEPILPKEIDLVKLLTHFETCIKEILANFNNFEYIQKKLGREILQVKESQNTIIGLENVNKDNILSLTHICERIEFKVTFLNQPNDNSTSCITKQLKDLRIQSAKLEVEATCNFKDIPRLEEWQTLSGEGEYNHMELMKTIDMSKEDFKIPDEYISARLNSLFTKSAKKWYHKMRQDHGKCSWNWWREQIIYKWENDSWRFRIEEYFEEAIFNIERDRTISWFLKQKDRLTSLHPDMSETMVHKRILRKFGG
ncbi:hypothetical protein O181_075370 [Austropuccinia psidii MF-1]|uniref:Retrotransposon gag domain-containing protein n=1 Tax=Austropuccinia psidii MF-1 TaxID=1389203 RepID=A0A9Q3FE97_9BASI|nr:hypothetical protein [Austropuccinia psidii MF-1]